MIQRFFYTGIILFGGLFFATPALAASDNLSVTAVVAPARYIYLDQQGDIYKVVSNTDQYAPPVLIDTNHPPTGTTLAQYTQILTQYGGNLSAGHTYYSQKYDPYRVLASWIASNPYFSQKIY